MRDQELVFMSAAEQARRIARRELSPVELTEAYLRRIERWDAVLRAYITVCADVALAQAREAETEILRGAYRGPLHGIPYGMKDQFRTRGIRTTLGSPIFATYVPDEDATVVERMATAGAVLLGKHNMDELGKGGTLRFTFGQPRNPWNPDHIPSGSSAGSGIAPAAGLCTVALGEDTGGSVRLPAAACGVTGLRPTYGRVSRHGGIMYGWTVDTIGPMARTVEDCALVLQAIAGHDPRDALSSRRPVPRYAEALGRSLKGRRLAVVREMTWTETIRPEVQESVRAAAEVLRSLGAVVEEVSIPLVKYSVPMLLLSSDADIAAALLPRLLRTRWNDIDYSIRTRLATAALVPTPAYHQAMRARVLLRQQVLGALRDYDALLAPVHPAPPGRIEATREQVSTSAEVEKKILLGRSGTYPFSVANVPAIAVPCGFSASGLPLGLQIAGRPFAEDDVLNIAHQYQQATDWHTRHPDLERTAGHLRSGA